VNSEQMKIVSCRSERCQWFDKLILSPDRARAASNDASIARDAQANQCEDSISRPSIVGITTRWAVSFISGETLMTISMYQASVPVFTRALNNLAAILEKGAAHAAARKFDETVLVQGRLFPDMFALARQVQIATDTARSGAARLAGVDFPAYEDKETTFADLISRVRDSVAFLETLTARQIDGSEEKTISWQTRSSTKSMAGLPYLFNHLLPNIHFHVTTAYNILRHNGVEVGKKDFLGP
jgi:uncharacterized protein